MVAEVESHLGGIDILVNNAGIAIPRKLEEISEAEWDAVLTVNSKSGFLVTQAVVGGVRERKWDASSTCPQWPRKRAVPWGAHYAASKAGIMG